MMKLAKTVFVTILFFISGILGTIYLLILYFWEKRAWLYYLLRRKRKQGRQLVKYCLSFSAASSLLCLPLPRNFRRTKRVLPQVCCRFFFCIHLWNHQPAGRNSWNDGIFTKKNNIAPNERNSSFVKGPETRLSLAGVYGRRLQKRQRTKPATAAVRAAGAKQQISRLQALYMPMQRFPP